MAELVTLEEALRRLEELEQKVGGLQKRETAVSEVRAEAFVLLDEVGLARAKLYLAETEPSLRLYDGAGRESVCLQAIGADSAGARGGR